MSIKKQKSHAFGKDIYLLGKNNDNKLMWLEEATWECDWYCGFGYVEIYTNNKYPHLAKDKYYHSHFSELIGNIKYDSELKDGKWIDKQKYVYHINENPNLIKTVLTDGESWELSDLMTSFYTLQETAKIFFIGNSHKTDKSKVELKDLNLYNKINKEILPKIFKRIYEILTPED